ncbi:hypothetical protein RI129_007921 [Pyrocoelia pectoralis]|uniref:Glucose-methanol-choline oxidoreductase N-terminal domain-containing protein n=1 Tax=Pyrocoelia pectoralis TaxID=417401 RepID=A0AAN7ZNA6_9COLE
MGNCFDTCHTGELKSYANLYNQKVKIRITANKTVMADFERAVPTRTTSTDFFYFRQLYGTFDHIVVGAGASGAIIATRLSEDPHRTVLLLEAGGHETDFTDIPAMAEICELLDYNWNFASVPQNNSCLSSNNRQCLYSRGKAIGGSTVINGLFYSRGNARDYDEWKDMGNDGWGSEEVLTFYKKLENYKIDVDPGYHGYDGYMNIEYVYPDNLKTAMFLNANRELGITIGDYNGEYPICAGKAQLNNINGRRGSTGRMYLRRVYKDRNNLIMSPHSYVTKILINPQTKRAYGVIFAKNKKYYVATSRKEIVLSAGSFGSPQLLMLSGIGPRDHLTSLGIPLIRDLPVGNFLQDHLSFSTLYFTSNLSEPRDSGLEAKIRDYLQSRGVLTYGFCLATAFVETNLSQIRNHPDIEILLHKYLHALDNGSPGLDKSKLFATHILLLHPKSVGTVRLNSSNPFIYPLIDPNFFSDAENEDMETMYGGIQIALQLLETQAFKQHNVRLIYTQEPECQLYEYLSKEHWFCQLKQLSASYSHPTGTCRMGPNSSESVVNHKLRVHGTSNLIVADASVMPDTISGHPSAACMMIGEKASHMIRNG